MYAYNLIGLILRKVGYPFVPGVPTTDWRKTCVGGVFWLPFQLSLKNARNPRDMQEEIKVFTYKSTFWEIWALTTSAGALIIVCHWLCNLFLQSNPCHASPLHAMSWWVWFSSYGPRVNTYFCPLQYIFLLMPLLVKSAKKGSDSPHDNPFLRLSGKLEGGRVTEGNYRILCFWPLGWSFWKSSYHSWYSGGQLPQSTTLRI